MVKRLLVIFMGASMLVALFLGSANVEVSADLFDSPVPEPPVNDDFANAIGVSDIPFSHGTTLEYATLEPLEPVPECAYEPTGSIWYAFTASESATMLASTGSFWFDTYLGIYTGASLDDLTEVISGCGWDMANRLIFQASAGTTYYIQVGGTWGQADLVDFHLETLPPPSVYFWYNPWSPSIYSTVQFNVDCWDPAGIGCDTYEWDLGDGAVATGCCPTHNYAADGEYLVELVATTYDGRTGSISQTIHVQTHDIAITELRTPTRAKVGETYQIVVGLSNRGLYDEYVYLELYKSVPGEYGQWEWIGSAYDSVPVHKANRTVDFEFAYTFTEEDAAAKKVSFRALAIMYGVYDAKPADNEAISLPTLIRPLH
ncbi:MAG: PKD domain-containing protein [Anaerolineae bacterium]